MRRCNPEDETEAMIEPHLSKNLIVPHISSRARQECEELEVAVREAHRLRPEEEGVEEMEVAWS